MKKYMNSNIAGPTMVGVVAFVCIYSFGYGSSPASGGYLVYHIFLQLSVCLDCSTFLFDSVGLSLTTSGFSFFLVRNFLYVDPLLIL